MTPDDPDTLRDQRGRFRPGRSGNPAGKPPGALNRTTRVRQFLEEGEERANARVVIERALGGDAVTARFLMSWLDPKPRTRPIPLELGPLELGSEISIEAAYEATFAALVAGEIAPEEAQGMARFLEQLRAARAKSAAPAEATDAPAREALVRNLQYDNEALNRENEALLARVKALEEAAANAAPEPAPDLNSTSNFRPSAPAPAPAPSPDRPADAPRAYALPPATSGPSAPPPSGRRRTRLRSAGLTAWGA
jgi:hypothetical protein